MVGAPRSPEALRRYRAQRCFNGFLSLPPSQRTRARSSLVTEAIIDYAYEGVPRDMIESRQAISLSPDESREISARLDEFVPNSMRAEAKPIMTWLHENLIPEAWAYPEDIRNLMQEILRET